METLSIFISQTSST